MNGRHAGSALGVVLTIVLGYIALPRAQSGGTPTLPQKTVDTTYPQVGVNYGHNTYSVHQGNDLQGVINTAQPGDEIVIDAGATFDTTSSFTLSAKSGSGWIVIRTSNLSSLPGAGSRVSPSDAANMPKLMVNGTNLSTIQTDPNSPSAYYRLVGLEITLDTASQITSGSNALVDIGTGAESSTTQLANNIIIDRCYIHGNPTQEVRNGVTANGEFVGVIDSYISDVHLTSDESHGVMAFNADGPFLIQDNYIEAAGQNVFFGGSDPLSSSLIPSDITIEQNLLHKKQCWRPGDSTYANPYNGDYSCGIHWEVKNLVELKDAQRVLYDGNIAEYVWVDAQHGVGLVITPRNQSGTAPFSIVQDITIQFNIFRHLAEGTEIAGDDDTNHINSPTQRVKLYNNLFYDVSSTWVSTGQSGSGWGIEVHAPQFLSDGPEYLTIDHNTLISDNSSSYVYVQPSPSNTNIPNFTFTNNIAPHGAYGFKGDTAGEDDAVLTSSWFATALTFTDKPGSMRISGPLGSPGVPAYRTALSPSPARARISGARTTRSISGT